MEKFCQTGFAAKRCWRNMINSSSEHQLRIPVSHFAVRKQVSVSRHVNCVCHEDLGP